MVGQTLDQAKVTHLSTGPVYVQQHCVIVELRYWLNMPTWIIHPSMQKHMAGFIPNNWM